MSKRRASASSMSRYPSDNHRPRAVVLGDCGDKSDLVCSVISARLGRHGASGHEVGFKPKYDRGCLVGRQARPIRLGGPLLNGWPLRQWRRDRRCSFAGVDRAMRNTKRVLAGGSVDALGITAPVEIC